MSIPDLEDRLRRLKLAEPPGALEGRTLAAATSMGRLRRQLRISLGAAAAAACLAVAVGAMPTPSVHVPDAGPAPMAALEDLMDDPALLRRLRLQSVHPARADAASLAAQRNLIDSLLKGDPL